MGSIDLTSYGTFFFHTLKTPMRREDLIAEKDTRNPFSDPFRVPRGRLFVPQASILGSFCSSQISSSTPGVPRTPQGVLPGATWAPHELPGDSLRSPGTVKNLQILDLDHTRVTDDCLEFIKELPALHTLKLNGTAVSPAAQVEMVRLLRTRRPTVR